MGKKKKVTIGYRYFLGIHFVLCHGEVDALTHVKVDDRLVWSGSLGAGLGYINQPDLFGGEKREGGIQGYFDHLTGSTTQGQNDYLVSRVSADVPAYRRVCSIVLRQMYVGTNPYLKKWGFRARRILKRSDGNSQWYTAKAAIGNDMNPAHIIYECLTDNDWGMGYQSSDIDAASFTTAADTLYSEGFGMSILWDRETEIENFVKDILRHIDAALYVDKATGTFTLKLIRADYVQANLKLFNEDNIVRIEDYACSTSTELVNTVTIQYWDATTGATGSMTVQDIAMVQIQGATITQTTDYGGITSGALAAKVASRDLRALSTPMMRCTIHTTRDGALVKPGDAIRLTWPDYGVSEAVMRVAMIDYGTATENTVKLTLLQDVFSLGTATYAAPATTEWVPVINAPQPVANRIVIEAPYYTLVRSLGETETADAMSTLPDMGRALVSGMRPTGDSLGCDVWADDGSGYVSDAAMDFCAYATCQSAVPPTATSITLSGAKDFYSDMITVGEYAFINNEIVEITSFSQTTLDIKRGCLDSVPQTHSAGSKIYVADSKNGIGATEYVAGETVNFKLLSRTGKGVLPLSSAPATAITFNRRALRPYPPGQFAVSGGYFPSLVLDVPITASWAHRNRLTQTGTNLVDFTEASVTPETGTTYELRLYNDTTSTLLYSQSGLTGTSHSGFPAMTGNYQLRMELWSVRDGYASLFKHSHVFTYENIYRLTLEDGTGHILAESGDTLTTE